MTYVFLVWRWWYAIVALQPCKTTFSVTLCSLSWKEPELGVKFSFEFDHYQNIKYIQNSDKEKYYLKFWLQGIFKNMLTDSFSNSTTKVLLNARYPKALGRGRVRVRIRVRVRVGWGSTNPARYEDPVKLVWSRRKHLFVCQHHSPMALVQRPHSYLHRYFRLMASRTRLFSHPPYPSLHRHSSSLTSSTPRFELPVPLFTFPFWFPDKICFRC